MKRTSSILPHDSKGIAPAWGAVAVVLILGISGMYVWYVRTGAVTPVTPTTPTTPSVPSGAVTYATQGTLVPTFSDSMANSLSIISGTVTSYSGLSPYEAITWTGASGTGVRIYWSDTSWLFKLENVSTTYVTQWVTKTMPRESSSSATTHNVNFDMTRAAQMSVKVADTSGTDIDNKASYSKSTSSSPVFGFEAYNTLDDSGWVESYDPLLGITYKLVFYIQVADNSGTNALFQNVNVTGAVNSRSYTNKTIYFCDIPAAAVRRSLLPNGVQYESIGAWQIPISMNLSGVTLTVSSDNLKVSYGVVSYTDASYFLAHGTWDAGSGIKKELTAKYFYITV